VASDCLRRFHNAEHRHDFKTASLLHMKGGTAWPMGGISVGACHGGIDGLAWRCEADRALGDRIEK